MTIVSMLLPATLFLLLIAAFFIALKIRASELGFLADAQEAQTLLNLIKKAQETFPRESYERRELYRGQRLLADNRGIKVGAYLTPRQIQILWPFVTARITALLIQRVDRTSYADANTVQDEQFELYLYRRFTTRMRKKGPAPSTTWEGRN